MARKRAIFLGRVQSFLVAGRKSWLIKYALVFTVAWSLILLPSLLPNFGLETFRFKTPAIAQLSADQLSQDSGLALSEQAQQLYEQGDLETAVAKLKQAIEQFRLSGDTLQQAQAWSNLSLVYQARSDWRQAEMAIANSIRLAQESAKQNPLWLSVQAKAFETQAKLNFSLGQFKSATKDWEQATQYYTQAKNQPGNARGAARSQLGYSLTLQEMGMHREALQRLLSLSEDRSLARALATNSDLQATCLRSLGSAIRIVGSAELQTTEQPQTLTLSDLGRYCGVDLSPSADPTADYLDQVTALFQKARAIAPSPEMRGEIDLLLGHTAHDKLRQLQDTYERQPSNFPTQDLQAQLAAISGAYEQAVQSSDALLQAHAKVSKLSVLVNLDRWLQGQEAQLQQQRSGEFFVGENALRAIKSLRQELGQPLTDQQTQLSDLIDQLNRLSPSHTAFYTRLRFSHSLLPVTSDQPSTEPITLSQEQMLALLENTLAQAKDLGDRRSEALAEGYLGQLAEVHGQWFPAKEHTQSAIAIAEGTIAPDIAYLWHWQMGRLLKQKDQTPLAIKEYEMAIANLDQVRSAQISLKNADIQFSFRDQVEPVYRQLIELLLPPSDAVAAPDQSQLEKARRTLESLQLAELENYLRCTLQPNNPKQLDSLSNEHNAAILYPIILPKQIAVIAKLPGLDELTYFSQEISESEVREKLVSLRMKVEENRFSSTGQQVAQTVYSWLIKPLEDSQFSSLLKSTKTLIFVSDGLFRNIPMAVLQDPNNGEYLIKKYAIALNLNLQLQNPQSLYDRSPLILATGLIDKNLGGLPNAEIEIETIRKNFPTRRLLNEKFTLNKFRREINSRPYTIVHIASHGDFTSRPETTGIKSATGLIKLNEIKESFEIQSQARPEPIELLVLSACRTSDGDRRATLGLAGIAVQSGARSTLASLWYVDDESTSRMMKLFYEKLKASNSSLSKAELLQIAQKELMAHPNFEAPRYWAPFVLLGNWL